jgi:recombination protein RecA
MSHALRKLTASIAKSNTLVIFINQIRMKIGVLFGNPETTSGGNALKFYASVRMDVRRVGQIKVGEAIIGNQIRVKIAKNKVAPPYKQAEVDILFGQGISKAGEVVDVGVREGFIVKSGAWYTLPQSKDDLAPLKLGQGREKARLYLEEHKELSNRIEAEIRNKVLDRNARVTTPTPSSRSPEDEDEDDDDAAVVTEDDRVKESE